MNSKTSALTFTLFLATCNQGTEVGNGVQVPTGQETNDGSTDKMSMPTAGSQSSPYQSLARYLLVACASPLGEAKVVRLQDGKNNTIQVTPSNDTQKSTIIQGKTYIITSSGSALPYEVNIQPNEMPLQCGVVVTSSMTTERLIRKVTFSDNFRLEWQIEASQLTSVILRDPEGNILETWVNF